MENIVNPLPSWIFFLFSYRAVISYDNLLDSHADNLILQNTIIPVGVLRGATGLSTHCSALATLPSVFKTSNTSTTQHVTTVLLHIMPSSNIIVKPEDPIGDITRLGVKVSGINCEVGSRGG